MGYLGGRGILAAVVSRSMFLLVAYVAAAGACGGVFSPIGGSDGGGSAGSGGNAGSGGHAGSGGNAGSGGSAGSGGARGSGGHGGSGGTSGSGDGGVGSDVTTGGDGAGMTETSTGEASTTCTDCSDKACAGVVSCVSNTGSPGMFVSYQRGSRGPCPAGYDSAKPIDVVEEGGQASCACSCSGGVVSCGSTGSSALVANCPTETMSVALNPGTCEVAAFPVGSGLRVDSYIKPSVTPCVGAGGMSVPKEVDGRLCTVNSGYTGCGAGKTCLPVPPSGTLECVAFMGDTPCPGSGMKRYVVATGWSDTRGCSGCSCAPDPTATCTQTFEAYADAKCTMPLASAPVDDMCHVSSGTTPAILGVELTEAPAGGGCSSLIDSPTGGETATGGEQTVCCY